MKIEVPRVIQTSTGPSMHTSPFRPENDRFWSICNEAGIRLSTHLASLTRYAAHGVEWNEEEVMLGDMDAFQWVFYYGDRPAMETVGAAILQGWFARFPNMKLLLSEQGTVWLSYLLRKMDHAYLMGRRATWGKLTMRPSEYFREHCFVRSVPRGERAIGRSRRSGSSRSSSVRTSPTARACRTRARTWGRSRPSTRSSRRRSCAATWLVTSTSRPESSPPLTRPRLTASPFGRPRPRPDWKRIRTDGSR